MAIKHTKQSGLPADGGDTSVVQPTDWYADHDADLAAMGGVVAQDLGMINVASLLAGPVTVYDDSAQLVTALMGVKGSGTVVTDGFIVVGCWPSGPLGSDAVSEVALFAQWRASWTANGTPLAAPATIRALLLDSDGQHPIVGTWTPDTEYALGAAIIELGHVWIASAAGTSGAIEPDFPSYIDGDAPDNGFDWSYSIQLEPSGGSARFIALITEPTE